MVGPSANVSSVVVDSREPAEIAEFWRELLGGETRVFDEVGVVALRAPGLTFDFVRVGDQKTTKNRWHLDLVAADPDATVERALDLGATRADDVCVSGSFTVMRDPEGNEFCVLRAGPPAGVPWAPLPS